MNDRRAVLAAQAVLGILIVTGAVLSRQPTGVVAVAAVIGLLATGLMPRSGWPVLAGALVAGGAVAVLCHDAPGNVGWFGICTLAGWCAIAGGLGPAAAFTTAATVVIVLEATVLSTDSGWFPWITGTFFAVIVCLMSRREHELIVALRAAQAGLADRVRAEERNRVARELHDVIAHSLTVSLLHVTSARLAVEDDPASAAESLAQAESLGRQSLTEVRHAVGLLRDGADSRSPLPGADELPALVEGFRRAGARVAYEVVGDPTRLAATTGLTVYRILQESLTNAVRHGAGAGAAVRLEVGDRSTVLTVDSEGAPVPSNGDGVGLHSMRERAEALGGELTAGPAGHGWRVHAVLPA